MDGSKRPKKKKNDLIDSFIEGDIKLDDIIMKMNEEKSKGGKAQTAAVQNNKRISEMFSR